MKKRGKIVLLGLLGVLFCLVCLYHNQIIDQWEKYKQYYVITLQEPKKAEQVFWNNLKEHNNQKIESEKHVVTLFTYLNNQNITNEEFARTQTVAIYPMYGYSTALFPNAYLLTPEDTAGCIIDAQTAWNLFGSTDIVGKYIIYQKRSYCIRDVVTWEEPFFTYEVSNDETEQEVVLEMAAIALQEQQGLNLLKTQLESSYQLQGQYYARFWMRLMRSLLAHMAV